jgi:thioredoxin-like negative regulator of GroEL
MERGDPADARLVEAEAALRRGTEAFLPPRNLIYWNSLGYVMRTQGRLEEALDAYTRVTQGSPADVVPWMQRVQVLERLGRAAEIPATIAPLLAARPGDAALRLDLAGQAVARGDRDHGAALLREVLQLQPGNTQAATMLRDLQASSGPR